MDRSEAHTIYRAGSASALDRAMHKLVTARIRQCEVTLTAEEAAALLDQH